MALRRLRTATLVLLACAGLPAAAHATTFTVDPAGPAAGCVGTSCKNLKSALAAVADGDTVVVKKGSYGEEGGLTLDKNGVSIINGDAVGTAAITAVNAPAGTPLLTVTGTAAKITGLLLSVQANGGPALQLTGAGAVIDQTAVLNVTASSEDVPTVNVGATTGTTKLSNLSVLHTPVLAAAQSAFAVQGGAASSLVLENVTVFAGTNTPGVLALDGNAAGVPNQIVSSNLIALKSDGIALDVDSAFDSPVKKEVRVLSSLLSAGPSGTALDIATEEAGAPSNSEAGDVDVDVVRSTAAGSGRASVIQALADGSGGLLGSGTPAGSVDVLVTRSIWKGTNDLSNHDGNLLFSEANTAGLTITGSDTDQAPQAAASGTEIAVSESTNTPVTSLFFDAARRNFHLRQDAPLVDKGGAIQPGEPTKDIDGQARVNGGQADIGADEFVNVAPVAKVTAPAQAIGSGQPVALDGTTSTDVETGRGGGIVRYRWDYGDGQTEETSGPTVNHVFSRPGTYDVQLVVVDNAGAASAAPGTAKVTIKDGTPPTVSVTAPKDGARLRRFRTRRVLVERDGRVRRVTRRTPIRRLLSGAAADDTALARLELSLKFGSGSTGTCRFVDVTKGSVVGNPCRKPKWFTVPVRAGKFSYRTKSTLRLRVGTYEVTARATDESGNVATSVIKIRIV